MSWRTKGEGQDHKHFKSQSNKGDERLPPMENYDIPDDIVKKARKRRKEQEKADRERAEEQEAEEAEE